MPEKIAQSAKKGHEHYAPNQLRQFEGAVANLDTFGMVSIGVQTSREADARYKLSSWGVDLTSPYVVFNQVNNQDGEGVEAYFTTSNNREYLCVTFLTANSLTLTEVIEILRDFELNHESLALSHVVVGEQVDALFQDIVRSQHLVK